MNKFEKISNREIYSNKTEDVALQFAEMPKFQEAIKNAKDKIEAMKNIRILLREQFLDIIAELPEPLLPSEEAPGTLRHPSSVTIVCLEIFVILGLNMV
ncbi:MAG: hypothetical protein UT92_C0001G0039 [Candidatus Curtissbacteria bacterium GW2011_GWA1_40_24]|uniref:Uncharacterized protein n=2 Tax=Patescibacteria group TaxID=1783273 RepID=A0A0G0S0D9_9BACT|nr:MAG: hypothetical protein UT92_C0001G0039 [Candidatus Curtissbacteria bacterium GW2011_GWA1_40_24]KKR89036.1 MAG: hypothetical protein UU38_C0002G0039 [Candidatus Wolfebacteria bacterium GW2011_GWB1_41_12]